METFLFYFSSLVFSKCRCCCCCLGIASAVCAFCYSKTATATKNEPEHKRYIDICIMKLHVSPTSQHTAQ